MTVELGPELDDFVSTKCKSTNLDGSNWSYFNGGNYTTRPLDSFRRGCTTCRSFLLAILQDALALECGVVTIGLSLLLLRLRLGLASRTLV
jgi:hypothetical protein